MASSIQKKVLFSYMILAATLLIGATADTYKVGDDGLGWAFPPLGAVAYKTWAGLKDFSIGDTVVFEWNNTHTVAQVSKNEYDDCTATNAIGGIHNTSPYSFVINSTDPYYFICTVQGHCSAGQKVTIQVGAASSLTSTSAFSAIFMAVITIYLLSLV